MTLVDVNRSEILRSCPFCGSVHHKLLEIDVHSWLVTCDDCGACGPIKANLKDAENSWNMRSDGHLAKNTIETSSCS